MCNSLPDAMSDFFQPPPPPPEERIRHRQPVWAGPPHGMLPGVVPLELVLARSEVAAVYVSRLSAYPTGVEFDLVTIAAPGEDDEAFDPMLFGPHRHHMRRHAAGPEIPDEMLRFGVEFADGRRATNTGGGAFPHPTPSRPDRYCIRAGAAEAAATGTRSCSYGRSRRRGGRRTTVSGRRPGSRSPAQRSTRARFTKRRSERRSSSTTIPGPTRPARHGRRSRPHERPRAAARRRSLRPPISAVQALAAEPQHLARPHRAAHHAPGH